MEKHFNFSNAHKDLIARDAEHVLGWRYAPGIVFEQGRGTPSLMSTAMNISILRRA